MTLEIILFAILFIFGIIMPAVMIIAEIRRRNIRRKRMDAYLDRIMKIKDHEHLD